MAANLGRDNIIAALEHTVGVLCITAKTFSNCLGNGLGSNADRSVASIPIHFWVDRPGSAICPGSVATHSISGIIGIAAHLTDLRFLNIPRNGYISPEGMITNISAFTKLEDLIIEVGSSPQSSRESSPDKKSQRSPPPTRTLVLVLFPTST